MKDFDWTTFTKRIPVKASKQALYDAWTKQSEIEKWFLSKCVYKNADGYNVAESNIEKGGSYEWNWYGYDVTEGGRITDSNGKDHLQFTFAGECSVDVHFRQLNDEVMVELTQGNIPTDEASRQNIRLRCEHGWSFFLVNLKSIYEGGIDLRNKNPVLKGVINS